MNLPRQAIVTAALITLIQHAFLPTPPPGKTPAQETDEATIYRIVLEERLLSLSEAPSGTYFVVVSTTKALRIDSPSNWTPFPSRTKPSINAPSTLEASLARINTVSVPIPDLPRTISRLVPRHVINAIFAGKGSWPEFYRRFPKSGGLIEFSRPAFTDDRQKALLFVSDSCGGRCGTAWLMYLTRSGATWRISRKEMLWIS